MPVPSTPDAAEARRAERRQRWLLAALLLWAFAVRLWVALPNPSGSRYHDEGVPVGNVERVLVTGSLRPESGYHPSLSYLPQLVVVWPAHEMNRRFGWPTAVLTPAGRLNALGYRLCRGVQVLIGVASLWAVYGVGRRLFGPGPALLAAFLLAIVPWHLRQSVIFKPDIALLLTVILAFWASLVAVERPTLWRYALAGAAVGLCASAKFNGAAAAWPLVAGTLWSARRELRRAAGRLAVAGGAAVAVFAGLNPFFLLDPDLVTRHFYGRTLANYEWKGARARVSHWQMPVEAVTNLLRWPFHGPLFGALGVAGFAAVAFRRWRTLPNVMLVSFPLGYVVSYALVTRNPSDHNWLPLAPFVALGAAAVALTLVRSRPWRLVGLAALALSCAPSHRWAYREAVPATPALARFGIARDLGSGAGRFVLTEVGLELDTSGWSGEGPTAEEGPLVLFAPDLPALPEGQVSLADGLVFPAARLDDSRLGAFYRRVLEAPSVRSIERLTPRFLRRRGPELIVVAQPAVAAGRHDGVLPAGERRVPIGLAPGESPGPRLVSLHASGRFRHLRDAWVESGGERHACVVRVRRAPARTVCRTARFVATTELVLHLDEGPARAGAYRLYEWRR